MELLRSDEPIFRKFGQAYVTLNYPGVVRAWHWHRKQDDHVVAVKGMIKVALYDAREGSATRGQVDEFFLGEDNNVLLKIPVGVVHGLQDGEHRALAPHQLPDRALRPPRAGRVPTALGQLEDPLRLADQDGLTGGRMRAGMAAGHTSRRRCWK